MEGQLPPPDPTSPFRRVVTGVDREGRSCVTSDGAVPPAAAWAEPGVGRGADPWAVASVPVDLSDDTAPVAEYVLREWPAPGGAIARMIRWEPGFSYPMHRSDTIDIGWVLDGQVELILETESVVLRAGDVVVQRGTVHGWRVIGRAPCTLGMLLLDAVRQSTA